MGLPETRAAAAAAPPRCYPVPPAPPTACWSPVPLPMDPLPLSGEGWVRAPAHGHATLWRIPERRVCELTISIACASIEPETSCWGRVMLRRLATILIVVLGLVLPFRI